MRTWKSKRCRWSLVFLSAAGALAACGSAFAQSEPGKPAGTVLAAAPEEELYLEITLNSLATGRLGRFIRRGNALFASVETLKEIGLKAPARGDGDGLVALAGLPGLKIAFDAAALRLELLAPIELLDRPVTRFGAQLDPRAVVDPSTRAPGLVLNYDLFAQESSGQKSVSAFTEARLFGVGEGVYSNTMISRAESALGATRHRNIRLDTYWQRNYPDEAMSLTVGDLTTGSLSWSRPTRVAGVRLSSNFALQPYRVTTPLASFEGSAVLPSTVDLFVNGLKQSTQTVQPGQFQLTGIPSLGGTGQAQMVITDINGQSRTVIFDLYGAPQLLGADVADWSLDLGTLRRNYGIDSFSYSGALASASGRYGLSATTTLEAHAEAGSGVVQGGAGGVWLLGTKAGLFSASVAASHQSADGGMNVPSSGQQRAAGYQWNSQQFSLSLNTLRRSIGFRDVASQAGEVPARGSDSAYFGISTGRWGQFGFSAIRQSYFNTPPARFAGFGWSYALPGNANLNLSLNRNLDDPNGSSLYLSWSMPLERNLNISTTARHAGGANSLALDAARTPPGDAGGWGWRVQAGLGDSNSVQGQVSQFGKYGQWMGGISQLGGQDGAPSSRSLYGSANGGIVWMEGGVYPSRRVDDAFALVSTSGVAGVPVRLENRIVGETDANGMLFVTQLNAYQKNRLSIDTLELPGDMRISRESIEAVPEGRSGMLARFSMRRILALQFSLRGTDGEWIPPGSQVFVEKGAKDNGGAGKAENAQIAAPQKPSAATVVGYDGLAYLEDPPEGAVLRVMMPGGSCRAALPAGLQASGSMDLGVLTCQ